MEELRREFQNLTQSTMREIKELKELRGTCKTHAILSQYQLKIAVFLELLNTTQDKPLRPSLNVEFYMCRV